MAMAVPGHDLGSPRWDGVPGPAVRFGSARRPEEATEVVLVGLGGTTRSPADAHRGSPAGRHDGAARRARRGVSRGARDPRGRSDHERLLVRGRREPADPHQEPGDASASDRCGPVEPDADEGLDPEDELRESLLLYRAYRDAGVTLQAVAVERHGLFRREPAASLAAALAGARPADGPPLDPALLGDALIRLAAIVVPPEPPPGIIRRSITLTQRASIIRAALRSAPSIVLQDLLRGVRDRVVVAVTFLAMLELMKRREIVVEQASSFGPDHGPSHDGQGARSRPASRSISRRLHWTSRWSGFR